MTKTKILLGFFLLALLVQPVFALDVNTLTQTEFEAYIAQIRNQTTAPTPITVQLDAGLGEKLDAMQAELQANKQSMDRMQEKFAIMAADNKTSLENATDKIIADTETARFAEHNTLRDELMTWIVERTNPLRMALPIIGVFFILTAVFLLWISRTYDFKGTVNK